jgi:hypothetical protein
LYILHASVIGYWGLIRVSDRGLNGNDQEQGRCHETRGLDRESHFGSYLIV